MRRVGGDDPGDERITLYLPQDRPANQACRSNEHQCRHSGCPAGRGQHGSGDEFGGLRILASDQVAVLNGERLLVLPALEAAS